MPHILLLQRSVKEDSGPSEARCRALVLNAVVGDGGWRAATRRAKHAQHRDEEVERREGVATSRSMDRSRLVARRMVCDCLCPKMSMLRGMKCGFS